MHAGVYQLVKRLYHFPVFDADNPYFNNAVKEAVEEIGLMLNPKRLEKGPRIKVERPGRSYFCQWFTYVTDMPTDVMELNKEEVAQVRWLAREVVKQMIEKEPKLLVESAPQWMGELLKKTDIAQT